MDEAPNMYPNLSNLTQLRLIKINKIKYYFIAEVQKREAMSKRLNKYTAAFDYFDKALIILSATSNGVSIAYFASIIGASVGIASASFSFGFSLATGIIKKLLKTTRNKNKKHNKIVMLARRKLSKIETLISWALIDSEISHEENTTIINEEEKYRRAKEDIRMMKSQISDPEKDKLIEEGKRIVINKIINQNHGNA